MLATFPANSLIFFYVTNFTGTMLLLLCNKLIFISSTFYNNSILNISNMSLSPPISSIFFNSILLPTFPNNYNSILFSFNLFRTFFLYLLYGNFYSITLQSNFWFFHSPFSLIVLFQYQICCKFFLISLWSHFISLLPQTNFPLLFNSGFPSNYFCTPI